VFTFTVYRRDFVLHFLREISVLIFYVLVTAILILQFVPKKGPNLLHSLVNPVILILYVLM